MVFILSMVTDKDNKLGLQWWFFLKFARFLLLEFNKNYTKIPYG